MADFKAMDADKFQRLGNMNLDDENVPVREMSYSLVLCKFFFLCLVT